VPRYTALRISTECFTSRFEKQVKHLPLGPLAHETATGYAICNTHTWANTVTIISIDSCHKAVTRIIPDQVAVLNISCCGHLYYGFHHSQCTNTVLCVLFAQELCHFISQWHEVENTWGNIQINFVLQQLFANSGVCSRWLQESVRFRLR